MSRFALIIVFSHIARLLLHNAKKNTSVVNNNEGPAVSSCPVLSMQNNNPRPYSTAKLVKTTVSYSAFFV